METKPALNVNIVNSEKKFGYDNNDTVSDKSKKIIDDVYEKFSSKFNININLNFD